MTITGRAALPAAVHDPSVVARFWAKVDRRSDDECWPWLGWTNRDGYGLFRGARDSTERRVSAHRFAYELHVGPIADDLVIDHVRDRGCTTRSCCNPAHLEAVTVAENVRRSEGSFVIRTGRCARGHDAALHLYVSPRGARACRQCRRERRQRRRQLGLRVT